MSLNTSKHRTSGYIIKSTQKFHNIKIGNLCKNLDELSNNQQKKNDSWLSTFSNVNCIDCEIDPHIPHKESSWFDFYLINDNNSDKIGDCSLYVKIDKGNFTINKETSYEIYSSEDFIYSAKKNNFLLLKSFCLEYKSHISNTFVSFLEEIFNIKIFN